MTCPICGQKPANCDCSPRERAMWRELREREGTPPTLTDAEREAVRFAATAALPETEKLGGVAGELCRMHAATLRGLLERTGGRCQVLPQKNVS